MLTAHVRHQRGNCLYSNAYIARLREDSFSSPLNRKHLLVETGRSGSPRFSSRVAAVRSSAEFDIFCCFTREVAHFQSVDSGVNLNSSLMFFPLFRRLPWEQQLLPSGVRVSLGKARPRDTYGAVLKRAMIGTHAKDAQAYLDL